MTYENLFKFVSNAYLYNFAGKKRKFKLSEYKNLNLAAGGYDLDSTQKYASIKNRNIVYNFNVFPDNGSSSHTQELSRLVI